MFARVIALLLALSASGSIATAATDSCPPPKPQGDAAYADICDKAFRLTCGDTVSTGFSARIDGQFGVVTALHGVLACTELTAANLDQRLPHLRLVKVDVERDAAFLVAPRTIRSALRVAQFSSDADLRIVGYPQALLYQQSHRLEPNEPRPLAQLKELLPPADTVEFMRRASPAPDIQVLSLSGPVQRGDLGAPILTEEGTAVAIADGGLPRGRCGYQLGYSAYNGQVE